LTAQKAVLVCVIKEAGDGVKPTSSSIVTVAYKGYYTDGVLMKGAELQQMS
jgi:FKBP-type peptidyl-prolyl cis-trans isomerase